MPRWLNTLKFKIVALAVITGVFSAIGTAELVLTTTRTDIERLLLHKDLRTNAGKLFLQKYGELIDLSASGQLAMRKLFEEHLKRVEWDQWQFPVRLYPFVSGEAERRPIAIDSQIAFGRPVVLRAGVSTGVIAERIDAGETVADLADDYNLSPSEIEEAIVYERAA